METIQTTAISQLVAELQEAVAWIESLGVRIGQGRFSTYARIASEWESFVGGGSALTVSYLYPRVATLAYEVPAFIKIFQTFRNIPNQHLEQVASMLRKAVHGALSIDDEHLTKPNPARDYLFEALTAAHVHRPEKGCNAIFDSPSDTGFTTGRHHVFIECKRLSSDAGLQANVKKAASQLNKAFQRRPRIGNRGLIALDVSRCLVSCDHLPRRSWPLFRAKAMLGELIAGFSSPGIQSHQEQLAA